METLNHFSNDQKAYLLYQDRLEATRVASTWQSLLKQEKQKVFEMQAAAEQKDAEIQKLKTLLNKYDKNQTL